MEIVKMKIAELKPADYNPRINLEPGMDEYEKLKNSLLEFGFVEPPIFNKRTGNLVGGHQRVAVAKEIKLCNEINVSVIDLPLDKEKALNVALNKISGQWDNEKLSMLLDEMDSDNIDLTGFDSFEVENLIETFDSSDELEDFYEDVEVTIKLEGKLQLSWKSNSVEVTKEECLLLDRKLADYQTSDQSYSFVQWLLGDNHEIDVS